MLESGRIDGQSDVYKIRSLSDDEDEQGIIGDEDTNDSEQPKWRKLGGKALEFALSSTTMFQYKEMDFKLHGFLATMVAIDVALSLLWYPMSFYVRVPYVLFRNALLFFMVLSGAVLRIKVFASLTQIQQQGRVLLGGENDDSDDVELDTPRRDSISVKSVMVTYLGGLVELREMSSERKKQMMWFLFPAVFHGLLATVFFIAAIRTEGDGWFQDEISFRDLYMWLAKSMMWCFCMTLLPVPGFDGAALLTLFLKGRGWNKLAIAFSLVFVAAVVTFTCGIIGVFTIDILALYLAVFCGVRLIKYAFNPQDENMKVLRAMAKTTKKMTVADIV